MPVRYSYLLLTLLAPCTALAQAPDTLIFGITHEPGTNAYRYAGAYLQRLCKELDRRCLLQNLPGLRGAAMIANGGIAGEMGRVQEYNSEHHEYRRIDEPFITIRTYAFTKASQPEIDSWQELEQHARAVSYQRGVYIYRLRLEGMRPRVQPHDVQSVSACFKMVLAGRDQACIYDDGSLSDESRLLLKQGHAGKPLGELSLYIYLGKDYSPIAPAMNDVTRHLNAEGLRAQLRHQYFISP